MYKIVLYSDEKDIFDTITNIFKEYLPALSEIHFKILKFNSTLEKLFGSSIHMLLLST